MVDERREKRNRKRVNNSTHTTVPALDAIRGQRSAWKQRIASKKELEDV